MVEFAKSQVSLHPNVSDIFKKFAAVSLKDSERGVHELFQKYGYTAPIRTEHVNLGPGVLSKFPFVKLSSWAQWLFDTGRIWRLFCGCASFESMRAALTEFWRRYRQLHPQHQIFDPDLGLDLSVCIPYYSHQDEGRGYKHQAIWIFSVHGAVGRGTHEYLRREKNLMPIKDMEFGLNFVGSTWGTQFLFATLLRSVTMKCPEAVDTLMQIFARDAAFLARHGLSSGGKRIHMIHLNTKGDLPALAKIAGLCRTFSHVPRAASSKTASDGICHLCQAGQESDRAGRPAYPYEDLSINPGWKTTVEQVPAWTVRPSLLNDALLDPTCVSHFFATDIWHNVQLGLAKHWLANSFVCAIERMDFWPEASVENRFAFLTQGFKQFCQDHHISPHMEEISRSTMGFITSKSCPVGQWSKGSVSTDMMKYLEFFCDQHVLGKTTDEVMIAIVF